MSTSLDVDIAALVGEMDAVACEHTQHGIPGFAHDDGPATQYTQSGCQRCGGLHAARPMCARFIEFVRSNGPMRCSHGCEYLGTASEFVTILGPVGGSK